MKGICEWCNKETNCIYSHHIIPRRFSNIEETINVCFGCHRRLESRFDNFVKYGSFQYEGFPKKEYSKNYNRKILKFKSLCTLPLEKNIYYHIHITYNLNTHHITISSKFIIGQKGKRINHLPKYSIIDL